MTAPFCTAGETGRFATANAVEFGECPGCGDGAKDGDEGREVPLFKDAAGLRCGHCCSADEPIPYRLTERALLMANLAEQVATHVPVRVVSMGSHGSVALPTIAEQGRVS